MHGLLQSALYLLYSVIIYIKHGFLLYLYLLFLSCKGLEALDNFSTIMLKLVQSEGSFTGLFSKNRAILVQK